MPSEFWLIGYRAGMACASANTYEIGRCKNSFAIAKLGGERLDSIQQGSGPWYIHTDQWKVGFFEGWMKRAEGTKEA